MTSIPGSTSGLVPGSDRTRTLPSSLWAAPWVAGVWALAFLGLALLGHASWVVGGLAALVLAAGAVSVASRTPALLRAVGWLLVALGVLVAVAVSDVRALAFLGYLPMTVLALAGVGPVAGHLDPSILLDDLPPVAHAVGGFATAATGGLTLERARRLRGLGGLRWAVWARWGRPAVAIAAVVPLCYAVTRIAWALGVPLGIRREMLDQLGSARFAGLGLALFAVAGAWLTTGLVARWGEVFWSWLPWLGGRRVPVPLAVVPGLFVAGAVTAGGLSFWRLLFTGRLDKVPGAEEDWAAWAPEMLWPLWGVALAVATLAYLGRRGTRERREMGGSTSPPV